MSSLSQKYKYLEVSTTALTSPDKPLNGYNPLGPKHCSRHQGTVCCGVSGLGAGVQHLGYGYSVNHHTATYELQPLFATHGGHQAKPTNMRTLLISKNGNLRSKAPPNKILLEYLCRRVFNFFNILRIKKLFLRDLKI